MQHHLLSAIVNGCTIVMKLTSYKQRTGWNAHVVRSTNILVTVTEIVNSID